MHLKPINGEQFVNGKSANKKTTSVGHKCLRLGQIVYILVFYNISFSWPLPRNGFQFIFLLRDSENDLYVSVLTNEFTISESRNRTGEERRRQALCDKRDINFV